MANTELERLAQNIRSVMEETRRIFLPIAEYQRQVTEQLQPFFDFYRRVAETIQPVALRVQELQEQLVPVLAQIERAFKNLPDRYQKAMRILADHGWYFDPELDIPTLFELVRLLEEGQTDVVYQKLCDHFDGRLEEIENDLSERFPHRSRILRQAFNAHRRGEYGLSIPVFLSQADGVCWDLVGVQLYSRRNGVPQLAIHLQANEFTSLEASMLCPLVEPTPISAGRAERTRIDNVLNRHAILHGESCDYDSRLNSCRSVSLLVYVAWILDKRLSSTA